MTTDVQRSEALPLLDRALLLVVVVSPFLLFLFPTHSSTRSAWFALLPLSVSTVAMICFRRRNFVLFARAVFWPMLYAAIVMHIPWPLNLVGPLAVYLIMYWRWPRFSDSTHWLIRGTFTKTAIAWMIPTILISSAGLLGWVFLFHPDLSNLARMVRLGGTLQLLAVGIAFSVFNAIWEEFILKGIAWNSLQLVFRRNWQINTSQAALFGLFHFSGFPRGWVGVLMAALYGLVLGIIREVSAGLLVPIVTHIFADATIFLIIYFISTGTLAVT
jgi:membrane protease YdiL (CAAX protease family)